jgi:hypothetical protein
MQCWGWLGRVKVEGRYLRGGSGEREHTVDMRGAADEHQPVTFPPSLNCGSEDRVNAGTIDERDLANVATRRASS